MSAVDFDTTSVNVWGDYDICSEEGDDERLNITYGHSKDKRPDLKQFMLSTKFSGLQTVTVAGRKRLA